MGQTVNLLALPSVVRIHPRPQLPASAQLRPAAKTDNAEVAQSIEHQPSKLRVAGLNPVFRSPTNPVSAG